MTGKSILRGLGQGGRTVISAEALGGEWGLLSAGRQNEVHQDIVKWGCRCYNEEIKDRGAGLFDRRVRIFPAGKKRTSQQLSLSGKKRPTVPFPSFTSHSPYTRHSVLSPYMCRILSSGFWTYWKPTLTAWKISICLSRHTSRRVWLTSLWPPSFTPQS